MASFGHPNFTISWLETVLKSPNSRAKISAWTAETVVEGQGSLSDLIKVSLKWTEGGHLNLPKNVAIKVPTLKKLERFAQVAGSEVKLRAMQVWLPNAHKAECDLYLLWNDSQPPLPIPRCFFAQEITTKAPGVLVLEDVSTFGMTPPNLPCLNLSQIFSIVDSLASLHVWSFKNSNIPPKFKPPHNRETFGSFLGYLKKTCHVLASDWSDLFASIVDEIRKREFKVDDFLYIYEAHEKFELAPVLVHGDSNPGNFFFRKENGAKIGDELVALIDWQMCHAGCPTEDLACLLYGSASPELRSRHLSAILTHYYTVLCQKMEPETAPFTFETLLKLYHYSKKYAILFKFSILGMIPNLDQTRLLNGKAAIEELLYTL